MKLVLKQGKGGWGIFEIFDGDVSKGFIVCGPSGLVLGVFPTLATARTQLKLQMTLPPVPFPYPQPPDDDQVNDNDDQTPAPGTRLGM